MSPTGCARCAVADAAARYYHLIDRRENQAAADLFAEDGEFVRLGVALRGPAEVFAALQDGDPARVARHFMHNVMVDFDDDDHARVSYDLVTYGQDSPADPAEIAPVPPPTAVLDCVDHMERSAGDWRISRKSVTRVWRNG